MLPSSGFLSSSKFGGLKRSFFLFSFFLDISKRLYYQLENWTGQITNFYFHRIFFSCQPIFEDTLLLFGGSNMAHFEIIKQVLLKGNIADIPGMV